MRRKTTDSGAYFVDGFFDKGPQTLKELKDQIKEGNTAWISRLAYFSYHIKGSPGYWRYKRSEVYAWVNHHIEAGNGPPTLFLTLSCAEHYWPDIKRLLQERLNFQQGDDVDISDFSYSALINDYSLVIQEYFQHRVEVWLSTVGKKILGIKHYWLRYEFAPGRGQIHAHMLAITSSRDIQRHYYHNKGNPEVQAALLADWAKTTFAMTASLSKRSAKASADHPSSISFRSISNLQEDTDNCLLHFQHHKCGLKCMRKQKKPSWSTAPTPRHKMCKAGAGIERTPGKCDTPGFVLQQESSLVDDVRGFKRIQLPRNHRRITQSSMLMCQSWRANCDIQILLYDSDPDNPDPADVARATDYIVAYACKGVETLQEEKRQMISLIMNSSDTFGDKTDVQRVAKQLLNQTIGEKMISKQEAMVLAGQLKLIDCSETLSTISISGYYKLEENKPSGTFLKTYSTRNIDFSKLSLHQYFHTIKNETTKPFHDNCKFIPHYVGAHSIPVYPPTQGYAKSIILVHTPWRKKFEDSVDFVQDFEELVEANHLPQFVLIPFLRMKARYDKKMLSCEPINNNDELLQPVFTDNLPEDLQEIVKFANSLPDNSKMELNDNFDYGIDYDWSVQHFINCSIDLASTFLEDAIKHDKIKQCQELRVPVKTNGEKYTIDGLTEPQKDIMALILHILQAWILAPTSETARRVFQPLHLTVCGQGGSGKSVLIKTILTTIRIMFQRNDSCHVCAPTGSAAHSAGGKTLHSLFGISTKQLTDDMSEGLRTRLKKRFVNITTLFIDERSLVSSELLATTEFYARETFHRGIDKNHQWGNLPIFLLVGDDFQLPPIQSGAFDVLTPIHQKRATIGKT